MHASTVGDGVADEVDVNVEVLVVELVASVVVVDITWLVVVLSILVVALVLEDVVVPSTIGLEGEGLFVVSHDPQYPAELQL